MRTKEFTLRLGAAALTCTALALAASQALAAEYWLKAAATSVNMPNPLGGTIAVPMWGYASCTDGTFATCSAVTVPGPALVVPPGDATLTVHLLNTLAVPTSLVINGLIKAPTNPMVPVWGDGTSGGRGSDLSKRVRSFDVEAQPNSGTQADYVWGSAANPVKPGTYLYQSGTQPQVQVQMGLYGAVTKNAVDSVSGTTPVRAQAYPGAAYEYDNQATLLYSEIDPQLHKAVAAGGFGENCLTPNWAETTPASTCVTSTINYTPKYYLINGQPFPSGTPVISLAGTTLLRLLNAGLTTHVPMIQGTHWTVVAEDGKPHPYRRTQYTALLPAAKTTDVLLTPDIGGGVYPIMDRRLSLSNNGLSDGGMLAFLQYGALGVTGPDGTAGGNTAPIAVDDTYNSVAGVMLSIGAPEGVLFNDNNTDGLPLPIKAVAASGSTACTGTYTLSTNGSFNYTPPATLPTTLPLGCTASSDTFTYQVTDGKALAAAPATVTINLVAPTAPTLAALDDFNRADTTADLTGLGLNWSQAAATGSPPNLRISGNQAIASATDLGGLAVSTKEVVVGDQGVLGATQFAAFTTTGSLVNSALILKASGTDMKAPVSYIRVRHEGANIVIYTMMGGSNTSVHVKQAAFPTAVSTGNLTAAVDAKGLVTVFQGGAYVGGVQLPDVAAWKAGGRIGIQLQTVGATVDDFAGGTILP